MSSYEGGRTALERLVERARASDTLDRNEATTRLHLIDDLLFGVLGWPREECETEERYERTYADYVLGAPARRMIVEAKREGISFELPAGQGSGVRSVRTLMDQPELAKAIKQVLGYSHDRGVPFAVAANGHQLVAFLANRQDGISPLDGKALVFLSLEDMAAQYRVLWDDLSRDGVGLQRLHVTLRDSASLAPPAKLSERLPRYPRMRIRNRLQTDLQILGDLFMEDVFRSGDGAEEEFLRECYSQSGALSQYALVSKDILRTRYSVLMAEEAGAALHPAVTKDAPVVNPEMLSEALSRRPIVLLGDVGVGKTMFIRNLISVEAKSIFADAISLYVDFVAEPAFADNLTQHVRSSIEDQLLRKYEIDITDAKFVRGVYRGALQRFDSSVFGELKELDPPTYARERVRFLADKVNDTEGHIRSVLEHLTRGRGKQIVIFLDNIDQRPSEFQEQVYVMAHAMAESWPAAVFVSLRPDTFFASKRRGALAAYQPKVFTIAPPRVEVVVTKRLNFVLRRLKATGTLQALPGSSLQVGSLVSYLEAIVFSLEKNGPLVELIDNLSGGNVRKALDFVQTFIASGNVDTEKLLDRIERTGSFVIEVHQFLRAILLADYADYNPDSSPIANIFDILSPDGREHFLLPILLSEVERQGPMRDEEGFVSDEIVFDRAQAAGFTPLQIAWCLDRAVNRTMLEIRSSAVGSPRSLYRTTSIGSYSIKRLPRMFAYLDAMVVDTPIVDDAYRSKIADAHTIEERLTRVEFFRIYLDRQWESLAGLTDAFDWPELSEALRADVRHVGRFANWP